MVSKRVWRIRKKATGEFITLGYNSKTSWLTKPTQAIRENQYLFKGEEDKYELVIFELTEIATEKL